MPSVTCTSAPRKVLLKAAHHRGLVFPGTIHVGRDHMELRQRSRSTRTSRIRCWANICNSRATAIMPSATGLEIREDEGAGAVGRHQYIGVVGGLHQRGDIDRGAQDAAAMLRGRYARRSRTG